MATPAYNTLKASIYTWIYGISTPIPAVWLNQNAPRISMPYITMYLSPSVQIGQDYLFSPNTAGVSLIAGNRELTLMLQYFGAGGYDVFENIRSSLERPTIQQYLTSQGIAGISALPILDITGLTDSRYEERFSMDILLRHASSVTDTPGFIEHTKIGVEINIENTSVYTDELNINP